MSESGIQHPPVVQIAGPFYVAILLNWFLYGILVVQVYIYFSSFKSDRLAVKSLVWFLFLADSLQSILLANDGFLIFARDFNDAESLNETHLVWLSVPLITAIVSCTVQFFFAYRVYILSKKSIIAPALIILTSLVQGIAAILSGVKNLRVRFYTLLQTEAQAEITTWHIATALCDVLIAVFMSYYLYKADTGIRRTHRIIVQLITLTVETGIATATVAVIDLILFLSLPGKVYFVVPAFVAAKLYANTAVVIFNNRATMSQDTEGSFVKPLDSLRPHSDSQGASVHYVTPNTPTYTQNTYVTTHKSIVMWDDHNKKIQDDVELSTMVNR